MALGGDTLIEGKKKTNRAATGSLLRKLVALSHQLRCSDITEEE
jgi:hypothetical protein